MDYWLESGKLLRKAEQREAEKEQRRIRKLLKTKRARFDRSDDVGHLAIGTAHKRKPGRQRYQPRLRGDRCQISGKRLDSCKNHNAGYDAE